MNKIFKVTLLLATIIICSCQDGKGNLAVVMKGLHSDNGVVRLGLFDNDKDFPGRGEKAAGARSVSIADGTARAVFEDCAYKTYAVAAYHDENENGQMDMESPTAPLEGYGLSNNAHGSNGPASFDDSSFKLSQPELEIAIMVNYKDMKNQ
ncbi:MAG: DUF2141 domain-containing protein [Spirochaetales bacterium]|nr:DUF2141 domain-containing protein [Spirochaetales bacterium]